MRLSLQGVRVVEFVHMVMGPICGLILADPSLRTKPRHGEARV